MSQAQRGELHDQPAVVAIDRQPRETIPFAEDQPAGAAWFVPVRQHFTQANRGRDPLTKEMSVQGNVRVPDVEAYPNLALRIVKTARDEMIAVGIEIDHVSIRGVAYDALNSAGVDPGMAGIERLGTAWRQDYARGRRGRGCTDAPGYL